MTIETAVYAGVVIMGAIIVAFAAVLILKSTSKKGIAQTQQQLVENIETPVALKKRRAPTLKLGLNRRKFPVRLDLKALIGQRRNTSLDKESSDEEPASDEQFSIPLPKAFLGKESSDEEPASDEQFSIPLPKAFLGKESSDKEPVSDEQFSIPLPKAFLGKESSDKEPASDEQFSIPLPGVTSSEPEVNDAPSSPDQETPKVEPPDEEEPAVNIINTSPEETAESAQGWPREEPEEPDEASDSENPAQPTNKDTVFDLFETEVVEENDSSKLAASLSNLDVHDLLQEAQNLMNVLRGGNG